MKKFLSILALQFSTLFAQYSTPGTGVHWNLDSLVVHSGGVVLDNSDHYAVVQDLIVSATDTLEIVSDETIRIAAARLVTFAGVALLDPPTRVVITAADTTQNFKGLRFENTPSSLVRRTTIEFGGGIKVVGSNMTFEYCIIRNNNAVYASGAIDAFQCDAVISRCEFYRNARAAISSAANAGSSPQILHNVLFENNTTNGNYPQINLGSGGLDSIRIIDNEIRGLYPNAGGVALANLVGGSTRAVIRDNQVTNNRYGIACIGNSITAVISHNEIANNNTGGNPMTGGSGLNFNATGTTNNSIVCHNVIHGNLWGITIQGQANPRLGDIDNPDPSDDGFNWIYDNGNGGMIYGLYNNTPIAQKAENNYWGTNHAAAVEEAIFHQADSAALGVVDYQPILEIIEPGHLEVGSIVGLGDSIRIGQQSMGTMLIRNLGDLDVMLAIKDTAGGSSRFKGVSRRHHGGLSSHRIVWKRLKDKMPFIGPAFLPSGSDVYMANDSIVMYDPPNDFLGRPTNTAGLIYPDVLKTTVRFGTFLTVTYADVEIYFNHAADTNILGVISWDTDQDFMTGLYPPLANLGLVPTDVGSEYEIVFTTSPTLAPLPAFLFASDDTSLTPLATAISLTRTGPKVTFRLYALSGFSFDDHPNVNVASGYLTTDGINALIGEDSTFSPRYAPDAAPDVGHGRRGVESNPSWLSFDVKEDTLGGHDSVHVSVVVLGSSTPGTHHAKLVITSSDSLVPRVERPVTVSMIIPPQPDVDLSALAIADTIFQDSSREVSVVFNNTGAGEFRYAILDTARTSWLSIRPPFGTVAAGTSDALTVVLDGHGLPVGTYTAHLVVLNNDTTHVVVVVPISMTVTTLTEVDPPNLPYHFYLDRNHPNPFNPSTEIPYGLRQSCRVELTIYNLLGQEVRTLVNSDQAAGNYRVTWDGRNRHGHSVSSGVFLYRLTAGSFTAVRKMILIK